MVPKIDLNERVRKSIARQQAKMGALAGISTLIASGLFLISCQSDGVKPANGNSTAGSRGNQDEQPCGTEQCDSSSSSGGMPGDGQNSTASGGMTSTGGAGRGGTTAGGTENGGTAAQSGGTGSTSSKDMGVGGNADSSSEASVEIIGRRLFLGGEPFYIRGVNWNPVPPGGTHPNDLDYSGFADRDIELMQDAGINTIRTYERIEETAVLDKLHAAGIYVFSTVYGWWQDDPSVVTARVNAVKDHPAIMGWVLGNEWNYNQLYSDGQISTEQARDQINAAAAYIKAADSEHPVVSIYGEVDGLSEMVAAMPDIDMWGINSYRGISHGDLFSTWESIADKPMFLGEYGADAYNADIGSYDPESQAAATLALTQEIMNNYITDSGGVTVGGFLFELADEWWKDTNGSPDVQDVGGIAPGGGPYPDQTFNEEYWGIVDIERTPRPAYHELKSLYSPE